MPIKFQLSFTAVATMRHYTRCVFQESKSQLVSDAEPPAVMPHDAKFYLFHYIR